MPQDIEYLKFKRRIASGIWDTIQPASDGGTLYQRDVSGNCLAPRSVHDRMRGFGPRMPALEIQTLVRCRICYNCLIVRKAMWTRRIIHEVVNSKRTWFVTQTFKPEIHVEIDARTRKDVITLKDRDAVAYKYIQNRMKFLRRGTCTWIRRAGEPGSGEFRWRKDIYKNDLGQDIFLRYFCITEPHKKELEGRPHYHLLIHEHTDKLPSAKIQYALSKLGHCHARTLSEEKIVDGGLDEILYNVKYMTKEGGARVRASTGYGKYGLCR